VSTSKGYIYRITNRVNGKSYIGQTTRTVAQRFAPHKYDAKRGSDVPLHRAMRKYGVENFTVEEEVSFSVEHLSEIEVSFIAIYGTFGKGYNATLGGDGVFGIPPSFEQGRRISVARGLRRSFGKGNEIGASSVEDERSARYRALSAKLSQRILTLCEERDWTQRALAVEAELDPGYISRIILGDVEPGLVTLATIAHTFGLTLSGFLEGVSLKENGK
jgi:Helix-turn-helix/GIY-YIG catalytic domain